MQIKWARTWLNDAPALLALLEAIFSLVATSAAAERNWSVQDFIISKRRNRLTGARSEKLVAIFWNLRMLAGIFAEREPLASSEELAAWRARLDSGTDFQHPLSDWQPSSNWGSSVRGDFEGMHGDDEGMIVDDDEEEQRGDELDLPASDWPKAALHQILPCPPRVPQDVHNGDHIAVWFGTGYNKWFEGVVDKVDMRRSLPVICTFSDGPAYLALEAEEYGSSGGKQWVLFQGPPAAGASVAPGRGSGRGLGVATGRGRGTGTAASSSLQTAVSLDNASDDEQDEREWTFDAEE